MSDFLGKLEGEAISIRKLEAIFSREGITLFCKILRKELFSDLKRIRELVLFTKDPLPSALLLFFKLGIEVFPGLCDNRDKVS